MLLSFALIFLCGLILSSIMKKVRLPGLLAYLLTGIILGPYLLHLLDSKLLNISPDLRTIALIIILIRAGLALNTGDLRKVGRPAILMSFIPATFEIVAVTLSASLFFPISYLEASIMGSVLAAVSPAVVVPKMLDVMDSGYGKEKGIPQLVLAAASIDDIYVIVLFTALMGMYNSGSFNYRSLINVPVSIILGIVAGVVAGLLIVKIFKKIKIRDTVKVLILLSVAFLLVALEDGLKTVLPVSGLLAGIAFSATIKNKYDTLAVRLSAKFSKIWIAAQIVLFVLIGAELDISYASREGLAAVAIILIGLLFRTMGVFVSLIRSDLLYRERMFCAIAYLPKATVQAAIGAIALAAGIPSGNSILTVAVLAILITAPLGALGIELSYKKLLAAPDKSEEFLESGNLE